MKLNNKPLSILFAADVPEDPNSGAAGTEYQTIQALRALGHRVDALWAPDLGRRIQHGNLHYLLELPYTYNRAFKTALKQGAYDVFHFNQRHAWLAAKTHRTCLKKSGRKSVFVGRSHGWDAHLNEHIEALDRLQNVRGSPLKRALSRVMRKLLDRHDALLCNYADGIIVSSSLDRNYIVAKYGLAESQVANIPQAPAPVFLNAGVTIKEDAMRFRMLFVSNFLKMKGVELVAQIANTLFPEYPQLELTWVCPEKHHQDVNQLLEPEARSRVKLHAPMSQGELKALYDNHGIFLYPSYFDGFGKVFLEAMACGLCVIGTRVGGLADCIQHEKTGLLSTPGDVEALLNHTRKVLNSSELWQKISQASTREARNYSWERTAQETEAFYRRMLELK